MARHTLKTGFVALAFAALAGCQSTAQPAAGVTLGALQLAQRGQGGGKVVSAPVGIDCSSVCSAQFQVGTQVTLTAIPDPGWVFEGWDQACNGADPECTVTMTDKLTAGFGFKRASSACPGWQAQCGSQCVDVTSDVANCGGCGVACATGESCVSSTCMPSACATPNQMCGSTCVDVTSDVTNCGGCGVACAAGSSCVDSACVAPPCDAPNVQCGAQCINPNTDMANCGGCGVACGTGQACVSSTCVADTSLMISATWDRAGDGDLLVTTPNGNTIWWNNRGPNVGTDFGQMARVDESGTGPETIYWTLAAPPISGTYFICFETSAFAPAPSAASPVNATINLQMPSGPEIITTGTFMSPTSFNGTCRPDLDTFVTAINYP